MLKTVVSLHSSLFRAKNRVEESISPRNIRLRVDTSPFLSSDAYAFKISLGLARGSTMEDVSNLLENEIQVERLYLPSSLAHRASEYLIRNRLKPKRIVLADDDLTWRANELLKLFPQHTQIYAVNLIEDCDRVRGIPLGLESPSYRSGGRLHDFQKEFSINPKKRDISILAIWNSATNIKSRKKASSTLAKNSNVLRLGKRISPQTFHFLIRRSLFVACPRGNGLDTHRIWESLYLGAIPIILKRDYFSALNGWPIFTIESWENLGIYNRLQLEEIYADLVESKEFLLEKSIKILEEISGE